MDCIRESLEGPCEDERASLGSLAVVDDLPTIKLVPAPREAPFSAGLRLLLVEDDPSIRTTLAEMLGDEGYVVTTATQGMKGSSAAPVGLI